MFSALVMASSVDLQFPPVSYSPFFVSFLVKAAATNGTASASNGDHEISGITHCQKSQSLSSPDSPKSEKSPTRIKWKQLAKNAFVKNRCSKSSHNKNNKSHTNGTSPQLESGFNGNDFVEALDAKDLSLLQLLAFKSLELSAPASDIVLRGRSKTWVQCSGHEGVFAPAAPGTIWKKRTSDDAEVRAYDALMNDVMCDMVPKFYGDIEYKEENFIEMQDLLHKFKNPSIMDIKMGTRTFLESEVQNNKARSDLYDKMVKVDPSAPTPEEHTAKAITKLRYMQFREDMSSSSNLGFRIEGVQGQTQDYAAEDLKLIKSREDITSVLKEFISANDKLRLQLVNKLKLLRDKFSSSEFFARHEVIGSSLLIIHDGTEVGVWMIDFAKTVALPEGVTIDHKSTWSLGNREDGYLFGLQNLVDILGQLHVNN